MKKLFFVVLAVGALSVATSSCKKDRTCECTANGVTWDTTYTDMSKKDAQNQCDAWNTLATIAGGSCALK